MVRWFLSFPQTLPSHILTPELELALPSSQRLPHRLSLHIRLLSQPSKTSQSLLNIQAASDVTDRLRLPESSRFPVAGGGFADIYIGELDGRAVAIKVIREIY